MVLLVDQIYEITCEIEYFGKQFLKLGFQAHTWSDFYRHKSEQNYRASIRYKKEITW